MRITSPPKYATEIKKNISPQSKKSDLQRFFHQPTHHLRSPIKALVTNQTSMVRQNPYSDLKVRQHQYIELIKTLDQENNKLKAELGKIHVQETQKNGVSTVIVFSPTKAVVNKRIQGKADNQRLMSQTFDNFHTKRASYQPTHQKVSSNSSPFSKKPVIMHHTSPSCFNVKLSPQKVNMTINFTNSNSPKVVKCSQTQSYNHSYNPSLISYQYPSQAQSIRNSPKKSFESIQGLNSDVFSNASNIQHKDNMISQQSIERNHQVQGPAQKSEFFDMKKRQVNYGSIFEKDKNSQESKNSHTTLKMSTKNFVQNKQNQGFQEQQDNLSNPITTKRNKSVKNRKSELSQQNEIKQSYQQPFDLDKKIDQNPLLKMLKERLQEEQCKLKLFQDEQQNQEDFKFNKASQYNQNIRFNEGSLPDPSLVMSPFKRNMLQAFPILNQLRRTQQYSQMSPQKRQMNEQNQQIDQLQHQSTHSTAKKSHSSKLSDKVSRQNQSQYVIEQVQSCHKAMTIVRMLQQNRRQVEQNDSILHQNEFQQEKQDVDDCMPVQQPIGQVISLNFAQMEQELLAHLQHQDDECVNDEQVEPQVISNKYYCQKTEQNQANSRLTDQAEPQQTQKTKKVSINQQRNISNSMSSKKLLNCLTNMKQSQKLSSHDRNDPSEQSIIKMAENQVLVDSQKLTDSQKLNSSSKYKLFYAHEKEPRQNKVIDIASKISNGSQLNYSKSNQNCKKNNSQIRGKFQGSGVSAYEWSSSTLRSQKFKKITNRAYL